MDQFTQAFSVILGGGIGGTAIAWFVLNALKKRVVDIDKIPLLEERIIYLEKQALQHNETKEAVIRMEEQIKNLTEQVRALSDLLMRKVFK